MHHKFRFLPMVSTKNARQSQQILSTLILTGLLSASASVEWVKAATINPKPINNSSELLSQSTLYALPNSVRNAVLREASERSSQPVSAIRIVDVQQRTWPNGCLGVDDATSLCNSALVPGYEITVELSNLSQRQVYRSDQDGSVVRLVQGSSQGQVGTPPRQLVNRVFRDLARQTGQSSRNFTLSNATRQNWPNTCLGLAQSGEFCGEALVEGWRLTVTDGRNTWAYRTDLQGRNIRLESDGNVGATNPSRSLLNAVYSDLANRTGYGSSNFRVVESTRQTWPDGCLGLYINREACLQGQVQGWRLAIADGRKTWVYRTDLAGQNIRLEPDNYSNITLPTSVSKGVLNDLANRTRINISQLEIIDAKQQTWPNSCLGLDSDRVCAQALVPGYEVTVSRKNSSDRWTYRTDSQGSIIRLAQGTATNPNNAQLPQNVFNSITDRLYQETGIPSSQIRVKSATRQTWPDGCLGLSLPNVRCTQNRTEGWRVELTDERSTWVYRTNLDGSVAFAENNLSAGNNLPSDVTKVVLQEAARRSRLPLSALEIISAEKQLWPNSCLGIPNPGPAVSCAAVTVPGWKVTVAGGSRRWVYHTNDSGTQVVLAENN